jgi:acetyl esterase/lipase
VPEHAVKKAVDMFMAATPPVGAPISEWRLGFERLCASFDIPRDARIEKIDEDGVHGLAITAGGGLAIATLLALRDAKAKPPAAGIAISPLLDLSGEGDSMRTNAKTDPLIDRTMVVEMGKVYIGDIDPHQHPLASPLWGKHHGLPPLLLMASASEVLKDDVVRLAASVRAAGGEVTVSLPEGMVHIWTLFPFLREAADSLDLIGKFARECWNSGANIRC